MSVATTGTAILHQARSLLHKIALVSEKSAPSASQQAQQEHSAAQRASVHHNTIPAQHDEEHHYNYYQPRRKKKIGTGIGYRNMLLSLGINFLVDAEQFEIEDYKSLVHDEVTYTCLVTLLLFSKMA
jgi:hypothetical protein